MSMLDILNTRADAVEKPKPLPVGTYKARISQVEFTQLKNEKQTPVCNISFMIEEVGPDVSPQAREVYGKDPVGKELRGNFFLTDDAMYRFTDFMQNVLEINLSGRTIGEASGEIKGKVCMIGVVQTPDKKDPNVIYSNIDSYAKA